MGLQFQSTPSLRKVTVDVYKIPISLIISIHTFLTEGDPSQPSADKSSDKFQSTPSLRKVTDMMSKHAFGKKISIHTFLTEGDRKNIYN